MLRIILVLLSMHCPILLLACGGGDNAEEIVGAASGAEQLPQPNSVLCGCRGAGGFTAGLSNRDGFGGCAGGRDRLFSIFLIACGGSCGLLRLLCASACMAVALAVRETVLAAIFPAGVAAIFVSPAGVGVCGHGGDAAEYDHTRANNSNSSAYTYPPPEMCLVCSSMHRGECTTRR